MEPGAKHRRGSLGSVEAAELLEEATSNARAFDAHRRSCRRCESADKRCAGPMAYCPSGRALLKRWRAAIRTLQGRR